MVFSYLLFEAVAFTKGDRVFMVPYGK